ncbi:hypothetical protein [Streptomyces sp. NBC_00868]|uniref:hypothetical protein n=1 Tax=Streptomyces sp. NBC_00868 TaxID=2903683 RepID=UPI0038697ABB
MSPAAGNNLLDAVRRLRPELHEALDVLENGLALADEDVLAHVVEVDRPRERFHEARA